jgi:hypothetical protein
MDISFIEKLNLSRHQIEDILYSRDIIDENGQCPYTVDEIFQEALEYVQELIFIENGYTKEQFLKYQETNVID